MRVHNALYLFLAIVSHQTLEHAKIEEIIKYSLSHLIFYLFTQSSKKK